jgi:hypothetical protein
MTAFSFSLSNTILSSVTRAEYLREWVFTVLGVERRLGGDLRNRYPQASSCRKTCCFVEIEKALGSVLSG